MADQEELRVTLRTVAENAGAIQTRDALRQVRNEASSAAGAVIGVNRAARESSGGFRIGTEDILRFAGALTGVEIGLSLFASAGRAVKDSIAGASNALIETQRTARATAASYGESAGQFQKFAAALSAQTGFTKNAILEAALSARTLSDNYGLSIDQTQRLIKVSADLAQLRGIGVAEAFERVQSAIRGEAEASEFLGLTLNATFLQQHAANGAFRETFTTLTDTQRAQVVYGEVLRQTDRFQGLAAQGATGLEGAQRRAALASQEFANDLGQILERSLIDATQGMEGLTRAVDEYLKTLAQGSAQERQAAVALANRNEIGKLITQFGIAQNEFGVLSDTTTGKLVNVEEIADRLRVSWDDLLAVLEEGRDKFSGSAAGLDLVRGAIARVVAAADPTPIQKYGETFRLVDETLQRAHRSFSQIAQDINDAQSDAGNLNTILGALNTDDTGNRAAVQALLDLGRISAQINAQRVAEATELARAREREAQKITDPRDAAGANAAKERTRLLDELLPKEQALAEARKQQADMQDAITAGQGALALATLQILPQQQEMARLERQISEGINTRVRLRQEETRLLAQQAALQPQNALEDTQAKIQRDRLLLNVRGVAPDDRSAARREIRDLTRNVLPGQELSAFDATRNVTLAQREEQRTNIAEQLRQNPIQQQIAALNDSTRGGRDLVLALQQTNDRLGLLGQVANAITAAAEKKVQVVVSGGVNVSGSGAGGLSPDAAAEIVNQTATQMYRDLIEGNGQAQLPPPVPQSGVRR